MDDIDINCNFSSNDNKTVFETTKQHIIMNIDTQLSPHELSVKLTKVNKIVAELVN